MHPIFARAFCIGPVLEALPYLAGSFLSAAVEEGFDEYYFI
jgi:hypothetical protein